MTEQELKELATSAWMGAAKERLLEDSITYVYRAMLAAYDAGVKAATPPPGHIIDDAGNVRKVRMQAVFVGGTVPCAIPLKPGETVMALEAAEAARKEGKP